MTLQIFFDPLSPELVPVHEPASLGANCAPFVEDFPNWLGADLVLLGLSDLRGFAQPETAQGGADAIRRALYRLSWSPGSGTLADLGNLRSGETLADTYTRLAEVLSILHEFGKTVVILGGSQEATLAQVKASPAAQQEPGAYLGVFDARLDMGLGMGQAHEGNWLSFLGAEPNLHLFGLTVAGFQTFFCDSTHLVELANRQTDLIRLGLLKDDLAQVEVLARQSQVLSLDLSVVKGTEAPGQAQPSPFGLSAEEAVQIGWYAGHSPVLNSLGLYNYHPALDPQGHTATLLATLVWYMLEAASRRLDKAPSAENELYQIFHTLVDENQTLTFWQHRQRQHWWLEVGYGPEGTPPWYLPSRLVEYQEASLGQVPDRWLRCWMRLQEWQNRL